MPSDRLHRKDCNTIWHCLFYSSKFIVLICPLKVDQARATLPPTFSLGEGNVLLVILCSKWPSCFEPPFSQPSISRWNHPFSTSHDLISTHPCHPNPNVFYWGFSSPLPSHPTPSVFRNHTPMFFTEVSHLLVHTSQSKCFLLRFAISSSFPSNIKCFLLRFSHLLFLPLQKFVPEVVSSTFPSKIQSHPPSVTQQKLHMRVTAPPVCCEDDTWLQKVCCV